jgi:uncharacterized protein (PEP-CTERM system associated)
VQRTHQAAVVLLGVRNTVALGAILVETSAIDTGVPFQDDFSRTSKVEQRSLTASWAYQLSAVTSISLLGSQIRNAAASGPGPVTKQSTARLVLSHQLSPKTSASLAARYLRFDNPPSGDVREKAITASLVVTFY